MNIPINIQKIIGSRPFLVDTIGMSDSKVICFEDMVLKIEKQGEDSDREYKMMSWLVGKLLVPTIFCVEKENKVNYLLMSKICGNMSCSSELLENPRQLTKLLAEGLKMLWKVDIANCPYHHSIDHKLRLAEIRISNHLCSMEDVEPETYGENGFESPRHLLQWLKENKPTENLVFSHGDYCLPNIFVHKNQVSGFIDLGRSGVADKYQDIALCYRSLKNNFNGKYGGDTIDEFDPNWIFEELGIVPDWNKIKYYILVDELF